MKALIRAADNESHAMLALQPVQRVYLPLPCQPKHLCNICVTPEEEWRQEEETFLPGYRVD